MPKWIRFDPAPPSPTGKTKVWTVVDVDGTTLLGLVKWFGRWRQYAFFPQPETVYERQCLRDIADFCERETKAHRARRTE